MSDEQKTKPCVFCGETILEVAQKCRYCGSMLVGESVQSVETYESVKAEIRKIVLDYGASVGAMQDVWFGDAIPPKKLEIANSKCHAKLGGMKPDETLLMVFHGKVLGMISEIVTVTDQNIYYLAYNGNTSEKTFVGYIPHFTLLGVTIKDGSYFEDGSSHEFPAISADFLNNLIAKLKDARIPQRIREANPPKSAGSAEISAVLSQYKETTAGAVCKKCSYTGAHAVSGKKHMWLFNWFFILIGLIFGIIPGLIIFALRVVTAKPITLCPNCGFSDA